MRPPGPYWSGWPALPMETSGPKLLPRAISGSVVLLQLGSVLMFTAYVMLIGIMHVEICLPCWALAWARHWACSSLDDAAGELTLPTMERWLHPSPGHRRAGSTSCLRGGSPSGKDRPAPSPPRPTSWAMGWSTLTSTPSICEGIDCAER